jgi:hypothetical protein
MIEARLPTRVRELLAKGVHLRPGRRHGNQIQFTVSKATEGLAVLRLAIEKLAREMAPHLTADLKLSIRVADHAGNLV